MTTKRTRQELRNLFKQGAMPSGVDFSDLIESVLNVTDDGLEKPVGSDQPLKIKVQGEKENILDVYSAGNECTVRLNQLSADKKPGLNLNLPPDISRLFIDSGSGNIGINTDKPAARLHIRQNEKDDSLRIDDELNDATPLVINSEGKMGIGVADPKASLDIAGDLQLGGPAIMEGAVTMKSSLTVGAQLNLLDNLLVDKNITVKGQASLEGTLITKGALSVTGNASVAGALQITGKTTISNDFTVGSSLKVTGAAVYLGGFTNADKDEFPYLVWLKDTNWDEQLVKHGSQRGMFGKAGFAVHMHETREWGVYSSGWDPLFGIEGKTGNTKIKGSLTVAGALTPSAGGTETNGIMFPKDPYKGSGDAAWIRYYARDKEATTLEIGTSNDKNDHIALIASGFVGIGTNSPESPLTITGDLGKQNNPNAAMHLSAGCILFGGKNDGKQVDSAQISAGKHIDNSLCIVGMAADKTSASRKIDMWAEGGLTIRGDVSVTGRLKPDYDSDWVAVDAPGNKEYHFKHNLNAYPSMIQVFVKSDNKSNGKSLKDPNEVRIISFLDDCYSESDNKRAGFSCRSLTTQTIKLLRAGHMWHGYDGGEYFNSGFIKLLMWK
jgi:hypothetical protein